MAVGDFVIVCGVGDCGDDGSSGVCRNVWFCRWWWFLAAVLVMVVGDCVVCGVDD